MITDWIQDYLNSNGWEKQRFSQYEMNEKQIELAWWLTGDVCDLFMFEMIEDFIKNKEINEFRGNTHRLTLVDNIVTLKHQRKKIEYTYTQQEFEDFIKPWGASLS